MLIERQVNAVYHATTHHSAQFGPAHGVPDDGFAHLVATCQESAILAEIEASHGRSTIKRPQLVPSLVTRWHAIKSPNLGLPRDVTGNQDGAALRRCLVHYTKDGTLTYLNLQHECPHRQIPDVCFAHDNARRQLVTVRRKRHCHDHPIVHKAERLFASPQIPYNCRFANAARRDISVAVAHVEGNHLASSTLDGLKARATCRNPLVPATTPIAHEECPLIWRDGNRVNLARTLQFIYELARSYVPQRCHLALVAGCEE
mmetsp:Transcript_29183/g.79867  ORF Transcript_29183/g.79867 Transcript_29183/m.79867 type:complete len:259 (-) Transcript_29183:320-1096(-)